jgi:ribonuclease G
VAWDANWRVLVSDLIVNATSRETRVAVREQGVVVELYIERRQEHGIVGNIYKGYVISVLPGIQAAFVDIGLKKAGFLYVADVQGSNPDQPWPESVLAFDERPGLPVVDPEASPAPLPPRRRIEHLLEAHQELLVQVVKEPVGTKGCRLASVLTLPGRYLVLIPGVQHIGVSRRIPSEAEKARLRELVMPLLPPGMGCIVRTLGAGATVQELQADVRFLTTVWQEVQRQAALTVPPHLVHQELDLLLRTLRDLLAESVDHCLIDDPAAYSRAEGFVRTYLPHLAAKVRPYPHTTPIFEAFAIEQQIEQALQPQVRLKSGGYITIDHTEALVAIDVNTGRFVGNHDPAETILTTNLEAVDEVVRQLRLRNIGGLIIIDFIDMDNSVHKAMVVQRLADRLQSDRARTRVLSISDLGLVEMTRQRVRASLNHTLCEPCTFCNGTGLVETAATICTKLFRDLQRLSLTMPHIENVTVHVHPAVADRLHKEESIYVAELAHNLRLQLTVKSDSSLRQSQFAILPF